MKSNLMEKCEVFSVDHQNILPVRKYVYDQEKHRHQKIILNE